MRTAAPYLAAAAALALGEALGFAAGGLAAAWPCAVFLCVLVMLAGAGFCVRGWGFVAVALLGLSVALSDEAARRATLEAASLSGGPFEAEVEVRSVVSPNAFETSAGGVEMMVVLSSACRRGAPRLREGDRWRVAGWLGRKPIDDRSRRTLWVKGRAASASRVGLRGAIREAFDTVKRDLSRRLGLGLDQMPGAADLSRAILLGERRRLPDGLRRVFADAGALHVFAVSGLHVGVVAATLFVALILLACPYRLAGLAVLPAIWGYVGLIGLPPSAVRAAAMATLYFLAPAFRRRRDLLVAWAQVFIVVHLVRPSWLLNVGSLLSFAVMLSIAAWGRLFSRGHSFAAWAGGVPIAARVFGTFTPGGLLSNLVLIPTASAVVVAGVVGVALSYVSEVLAAHVNNAAALFTRLMVAVSGAVAAIPGASVAVAPWTAWQCAAWYLVLVLSFGLVRSVRMRRLRTV